MRLVVQPAPSLSRIASSLRLQSGDTLYTMWPIDFVGGLP